MKTKSDTFPQEQFLRSTAPVPPHFGELDDCIDPPEPKPSLALPITLAALGGFIIGVLCML